MRAVLLIDEEMFRADDPHFTKHRPDPGYDSEFHVAAALRRLGYEAVAVPAVENLVQIVSSIKDMKPDVVFNLVEHIGGNRSNDSAAAAMLEVEKIPFTGATARALTISRDKHLSKLIVSAAGVAVPKSVVINGRSLRERDWSAFPAIVKPLDQDGSDGIEARSYVESGTQLRRQVRRATEEFSRRVICEEYIAGREFIVTVSGIDRVSIDSVRELVFPETAEIKFATQKVKFDQKYKKRQGIHYATHTAVPSLLDGKLQWAAKTAYKALGIESYAKLEFRVRGREVVFIEANPNSVLSPSARTTDFSAIGYDKFIRKLVRMGLKRHARANT